MRIIRYLIIIFFSFNYLWVQESDSTVSPSALPDSLRALTVTDTLRRSPPLYSLEEHITNLGLNPEVIQVITKDQLARDHPFRVHEILSDFFSLAIIEQGEIGHPIHLQSGFIATEYVRVLVNGLPVSDNFVGVPLLENLPVALIERVELAPPEVMGIPTINIITFAETHRTKPTSSFRFCQGSKNRQSYIASIEGPMNERIRGQFSYNFNEVEGFQTGNGSKISHFNANLLIRISAKWRLALISCSRGTDIDQNGAWWIDNWNGRRESYHGDLGFVLRSTDTVFRFNYSHQMAKLTAAIDSFPKYDATSYDFQAERLWTVTPHVKLKLHAAATHVSMPYTPYGPVPDWTRFSAGLTAVYRLNQKSQFLLNLQGQSHRQQAEKMPLNASFHHQLNHYCNWTIGFSHMPQYQSPYQWIIAAGEPDELPHWQDFRTTLSMNTFLFAGHLSPYAQKYSSELFDYWNYGVAFLASVNLWQSLHFSTKGELNKPDNVLLEYLPIRLNSKLEFPYVIIRDGLTLNCSLETEFFQRKENENTFSEFIVHSQVEFDFGDLRAFIRFNNLTDEVYRYRTNLQEPWTTIMPGHHYYLGFHWNFLD